MRKALIWMFSISLVLVGCGTTSLSTGNTLKISSNVEFGEEDYKDLVSSNNALGFDLLSKVSRSENGNVFVSPTSLFMALSMVYNGADGVTKEELENVLNVDGLTPEDLNRANASLMTLLDHNSDKIQLNIANSIWLNNKYQFQAEFASTNRDYYNAEITEIDVQNPQTPKTINEWVNNKTNGKIDNVVGENLSPDMITMLINAIYFKGSWTYPFDTSLTKEKKFTLQDGSTIEVPLMEMHEELSYTKNNMFQAVSLPYGDEKITMKVFLPNENVSLKEFEEMLTMEQWQEWQSSFYKTEGTVLLPKFTLEYEVELRETLEALGMSTAFNNANLSKMIEGTSNSAITSVKQKTYIDLNEEGTEAAAVTSVIVSETSMQPTYKPFHMEVNRPFFIAIVDETSNAILFMGTIANPK
ncbi:serpin family protein [Ureibacillus acetophenoni]|uniref:Serpin B n=1 Tax=Ureibacillus acetophenoni TaxID=614649 RepID=A0A285UHH9_9BACL|nr:serpin family protein [Ureibacillus acetophenoni]SOC39701.1 serpin B [Ureibacillus acetophenoni]